MKPKRIIDLELLETVRRLPCIACSQANPEAAREAILNPPDESISHTHHLISRGAGGGDTATNVMPLCFRCHTEIHKIGLIQMAKKYRTVFNWAQSAGLITPAESTEEPTQSYR